MNENQITQEPIEIDIDRSVYEEPYVVKDGCLYEEVTTKNKTEYVKLADFVPTLKAEITYDDGTEEIEALDDIKARWVKYVETGELDWWLTKSPQFYMK